jgi:hypothetical protein
MATSALHFSHQEREPSCTACVPVSSLQRSPRCGGGFRWSLNFHLHARTWGQPDQRTSYFNPKRSMASSSSFVRLSSGASAAHSEHPAQLSSLHSASAASQQRGSQEAPVVDLQTAAVCAEDDGYDDFYYVVDIPELYGNKISSRYDMELSVSAWLDFAPGRVRRRGHAMCRGCSHAHPHALPAPPAAAPTVSRPWTRTNHS